MVRFFSFEQYHNKRNIGSTYIRVHQLIKYWPEAGLYRYGENPDVLVFQKVYCQLDYKFPAHFENTTILDICDPDWLMGKNFVKETLDAVDAVTCPTEPLAKFLRQMTDKPVKVIKDRFDVEILPRRKKHTEKAKTVVWFGYRHNADVLKPAIKLLDELDLNLIIIGDDDPMLKPLRKKKDWYKFIKYNEETIYKDLQRADFALLPQGNRPQDPFKSENKTIKAILAGLPVAKTPEDVSKYIDAEARELDIQSVYGKIKSEYDVRNSVKEMKELIEDLNGTTA